MRYFFVRKKVELSYDYLGYKTNHIFNPIPEDATEVQNSLIYFTTGDHLEQIGHESFKAYNEDRLFEINGVSQDNFPILFDKTKKIEENIKPFIGREKISIGIVNGMSSAMGDHLIGMKALNLFHNELSKYFKNVEIVLYQLIPKHIFPITVQDPIIHHVVGMPAPVSRLEKHDLYLDFGGMIVWENFNNQPMIDFYLEELGLDKTKISPNDKRCSIKLSDQAAFDMDEIIKVIKHRGRPVLLFQHHSSSDIRTIHEHEATKMVKDLLEQTDYTVVSTMPNFNYASDRFVNVSPYTVNEFDRFVYLISKMDAVLTVDTVAYHISDALCIPTVVLFTSIEPDLRARYYPYVQSIMLEDPKGRVYGKHKSNTTNDKFHVRKLFKKLKIEDVIEALKTITSKKQKKLTCPICYKETKERISDWYRDYNLHRCENCMCEFAMPRKPQDYDAAYEVATDTSNYDHYLKDCINESRDRIINNYMAQVRFTMPKRFVEFLPKGKSLDIGCANGFWVGYMADKGHDAYGVDACKAVIELAKVKMKSKNFSVLKVKDTNKFASKLPKSWGKDFDLVTSFELLEHVPDPNEFAAQVNKVLKVGGYWLFSTPNRDRLPFFGGVKNTRAHNGVPEGDFPPEHLQRFNKLGHRIVIENNGFEIMSQKTTALHTSSLEATIQETLPNFEVAVNGELIAATKTILEGKLNRGLNKIEGYGTFLITIARKINEL